MQLVAQGAQDAYLTGDPKITFFKAQYKPHTNFAMECIEQVINGTPSAGGSSSVTISRNGDLVQEMFLKVTINSNANAQAARADDSATVYTAERVISECELSIGGQRIDKHYQRWWRLFTELNYDEAAKAKYSKMCNAVGNSDTDTVYLPLIFFFNRNPGLALPLIALQYHEVRVDFKWSSDDNIWESGNGKASVKCFANYIYLDTKERTMFAQKSHEYLIEQVQHTGAEAVSSTARNIRLNYTHPVKELVWCCPQTTGVSTAAERLWNLTANDAANGATAIDASGSTQPHLSDGIVRLPLATLVDDAMPLFKLQLNGQDRMAEQDGKYFNQVQPLYHHSGCPAPGVYSYSFALKPEEHQPSGTCNFSRIDNATAVVTAANEGNLEMFAVNYNILRVMSGMGGIAFSN